MNKTLTGFLLSSLSFAAVAQESNYGMPPLPPNARAGECYARTFTPPVFRTETEQALKTAATERLEIIPAEYAWTEERVLVKPEGEKIVEVIPPEYRTVQEQVLVKPASEKIVEVPATYKNVEERQLVKPATVQWKQGRGPIERIDNGTGEIMCLVEIPAEYKTVTRKVVDVPASTQRIPVPAEYTTVARQELVREAMVKKVIVPAEYKTVKVRKLVSAAQEQRIPIPAEYQTVSKQVLVSESRMEWKSVLCETNATPDTVYELQRALRDAGYDPVKIDGRLGAGTLNAVKRFQQANGLAQGGVTMETLQRLGVQNRTNSGGL